MAGPVTGTNGFYSFGAVAKVWNKPDQTQEEKYRYVMLTKDLTPYMVKIYYHGMVFKLVITVMDNFMQNEKVV